MSNTYNWWLNEVTFSQVIWMMRELVKSGVARTDAVVHNLLRQIAGYIYLAFFQLNYLAIFITSPSLYSFIYSLAYY